MSNNSGIYRKNEESVNSISVVDSPLKYKLTISEFLENRIRFMCNKLPNNEWSGILFYKYKGSFKENDISFEAVDFLLMDIGSAGFTEFDMNADVSTYMVENPELLDCKTGLIH